ncbi:MAG TPA: glycoside hydrolase family 1 protein, partial [Proteobacteria bacterium]|nr:glycoside hydrolase family 1 protein [Pseudomonadota bacterium]
MEVAVKRMMKLSADVVKRELEDFEFPDRFSLGTATAGYQVEGGYNTADGPKNNWYEFELKGKVEKTGAGCNFWELYPEDFARCRWMGNNAFRMGIDWARLQPGERRTDSPPPLSQEAIERYADIINEARKNGLDELITLFHWTHPFWVGGDLWTNDEKVKDLFVPALVESVERINAVLVEKHGSSPIRRFITMNEPLFVPLTTYILKIFPGYDGLPSLTRFKTSYINILWAHLLLYKAIHELYRKKGWTTPEVSLNPWGCCIYELDKMTFDLFLAKANGVGESEITKFLNEERRATYAILSQAPRRSLVGLRRTLENLAAYFMKRRVGRWSMEKLLREMYDSEHERFIDYLPFDFYDPFIADYVRFSTIIKPARWPWEWWSVPEALGYFLKAYSRKSLGLPIRIVENGIGFECPYNESKAKPRPDGIRRHEVIQAHMFEIVRAIKEGINIDGYYHWSLIDNYEWGSFTPRFGIFGVVYPEGARRLKTDILGDNEAGAYKLICEAF